MKKLICLLFAVLFLCSYAFADDEEEELLISKELYVTANLLNGRQSPSKKASVEAIFDRNDCLEATGEWSKNHEWVEVYGGETGTVWCSIKYLSEIREPVTYENRGKAKIKIRKKPFDGKVISYLRGGRTIEILQIVNGWGRCKLGWIDMSYLVEY